MVVVSIDDLESDDAAPAASGCPIRVLTNSSVSTSDDDGTTREIDCVDHVCYVFVGM